MATAVLISAFGAISFPALAGFFMAKPSLLKCFCLIIWFVLMRRLFYFYIYIPKGIYI